MRTIAIPGKIYEEQSAVARLKSIIYALATERSVMIIASLFSLAATVYFFQAGYIIAYGDAESHLNIAKRVVSSITPGLAQLGGIWLPLPHLLLAPFVYFDWLWRTGLAGSIVSGMAFIISTVYIFKLTHILTKHRVAALFAAFVFMLNPNILYLQSTPMTELVLIAFFMLSSYYFIIYLHDNKLVNLIYAAFFGFCASLSRYDGWALVLMQAGIIALAHFPYALRSNRNGNMSIIKERSWRVLEGRSIIYMTLAFFGIFLWLLWGYLILSDPLYFTHSEFSAKSQQQSWLARGELPAYQNIASSVIYYAVTVIENMGIFAAAVSIIGILIYALDNKVRYRFFTLLVLTVPFIFNVATLYIGQSIIFIPSLTPSQFSWNLFNVRYGVMMIPFLAFAAGYAFNTFARTRIKYAAATILVGLIVAQSALFVSGRAQVISLEDGRAGLSSEIAKVADADLWFNRNYDSGIVLLDDFSRVIRIVRSPVEMRDIIYVGNKPYWEESLVEPEKHAQWIIMQRNDAIWKNIWENPVTQARLFSHFNKVYTSDDILIFKRINNSGGQ